MNVGGVEKALLGLLSVIPMDQYEVHVGMIHKRGGFLSYLPKDVIVHEIDCYAKYWWLINDPPLQCIKKLIKNKQVIEGIIHLLLYVHFKITHSRHLFYDYILRNEPYLEGAFDIAVSFAGPSQMMDYYVCKKVNAKEKYGWIHFDVSKFGIDKGMTSKLYKQYKKIFIVSEEGKKVFDQMFPQFKNKTEVFYNIVSPEQIKDMANKGETFNDDYRGKRLLTVGRISEEKGQTVAIEALRLLIRQGYDLRWYFIGEGKDLEHCKQLVQEYGLESHTIFLGLKVNPYGYMKNCDIYVQPSRHEGYCITLAEALCFAKPIVSTDFTGANEQLKNRENGIVIGMKAQDIADGIIRAFDFPLCTPSLSQNEIHQNVSFPP